jgi:hypothetical protein
MVQRRQRERSLFEVLLPDGHKLWPDWLRKIDTLLEDEARNVPDCGRGDAAAAEFLTRLARSSSASRQDADAGESLPRVDTTRDRQ